MDREYGGKKKMIMFGEVQGFFLIGKRKAGQTTWTSPNIIKREYLFFLRFNAPIHRVEKPETEVLKSAFYACYVLG